MGERNRVSERETECQRERQRQRAIEIETEIIHIEEMKFIFECNR